MAINPNLTQLDPSQAITRTVDASEDAIRTIPANGTTFAIELSRDDGDSVNSYSPNSSTKQSLTVANTGVVMAAMSVDGFSRVNLYSKSTTAIVAPPTYTVQVSPHDTDDIWVNTTLTLVPSASLNATVAGIALSNLVARRIRVSASAALGAAETADLYLVLGA